MKEIFICEFCVLNPLFRSIEIIHVDWTIEKRLKRREHFINLNNRFIIINMLKNTVLLILPVLAQAADSCKALVLSGGGANGAWEAGVFWGLNNYGISGNFDYHVISGVSAGAINAAALAGWAPNDGINAAEYLSSTWSNLVNSDIWVEWPLGLAEGLVKPGLLNNAPAVQFLTE